MIKLEPISIFALRDESKKEWDITRNTDVGPIRIGGVRWDGKEFFISFCTNCVISGAELKYVSDYLDTIANVFYWYR